MIFFHLDMNCALVTRGMKPSSPCVRVLLHFKQKLSLRSTYFVWLYFGPAYCLPFNTKTTFWAFPFT